MSGLPRAHWTRVAFVIIVIFDPPYSVPGEENILEKGHNWNSMAIDVGGSQSSVKLSYNKIALCSAVLPKKILRFFRPSLGQERVCPCIYGA